MLDKRSNKAYALSHKKVLNFGEGYVYVTTKKDEVKACGYIHQGEYPPELVEIRDYLRSIPFKERIKKMKHLEKTINSIEKFKL